MPILDTLEKCRRLREEIIRHDGMVQEAKNLLYGKTHNVAHDESIFSCLVALTIGIVTRANLALRSIKPELQFPPPLINSEFLCNKKVGASGKNTW